MGAPTESANSRRTKKKTKAGRHERPAFFLF
jgi:hypothetical protein